MPSGQFPTLSYCTYIPGSVSLFTLGLGYSIRICDAPDDKKQLRCLKWDARDAEAYTVPPVFN